MNSNTVVVIGSNSFSGSDFIDLLLDQTEYNVVGVSRSHEKSRLYLPYRRRTDLSRFGFFQMDLNRHMPALLELLSDCKPIYVVNFAAQSEVARSWQHPEQWFQTNTMAVVQLVSFLKDQDWLERYLHISTPEVYGSCDGPVTEVAPLNPSTPYAASKAAAELMLRAVAKHSDFPLVMVRSANVYGAHQQLYKIVPRSVIYLKKGWTIQLHGGGRHLRSFIHIRDVSRAELAAMKRGPGGEIYNLSSDGATCVRDVVRRICEIMGQDFERSTADVDDRPGQDHAYIIDSSKAREKLGWRPDIGLEEGLRQVIDWVDREWSLLQAEPLQYVHKP